MDEFLHKMSARSPDSAMKEMMSALQVLHAEELIKDSSDALSGAEASEIASVAAADSVRSHVCRLCERSVPMEEFQEHCLFCLIGSDCANSVAANDVPLERRVDDAERALYLSAAKALRRYLPDFAPEIDTQVEGQANNMHELKPLQVGEEKFTRHLVKLCRDALKPPQFTLQSVERLKDTLYSARQLYEQHDAHLSEQNQLWKDLLRTIETKVSLLTSAFSACLALVIDPGDPNIAAGKLASIPLSTYDHPGFAISRHAFGLSVGEPHLRDFHILKPIKGGAFGLVFLVKHAKTGDYCAMKVLKKSHLQMKNQRERVSSEQAILATTANPWIVKMYYSFESKENLFIVMEYLPGGDCLSFLEKFGIIEEGVARQYLAETVLAIEYLHSRGIVHRDIKPDNILIGKDGHIKLTDFGLSTHGLEEVMPQLRSGAWAEHAASAVAAVDTEGFPSIVSDYSASAPPKITRISAVMKGRREKAYSCVGTPDYLAPEVIRALGHDAAVDWWALGCVMYEFLTGEPPFAADSPEMVFRRILNDSNLYFDEEDGISKDAQDLIAQLLIKDPSNRIGNRARGVAEIKQHPFFAGMDWDKLHDRKALFEPKPRHVEDTSYFGPDVRQDQSADIEIGTLLAEQQRGVVDSSKGGSCLRNLSSLATGKRTPGPVFAFRNLSHLAEMNQVVLSNCCSQGQHPENEE